MNRATISYRINLFASFALAALATLCGDAAAFGSDASTRTSVIVLLQDGRQVEGRIDGRTTADRLWIRSEGRSTVMYRSFRWEEVRGVDSIEGKSLLAAPMATESAGAATTFQAGERIVDIETRDVPTADSRNSKLTDAQRVLYLLGLSD